MKNFLFNCAMITLLASILLTLGCATPVDSFDKGPTAQPKVEAPIRDSTSDQYKTRYGLTDIYQKATDDKAQGDERLYGTRNFRVLFHGILYRGGGGNKSINPPRANDNPLPEVALENLCKEGFSSAIYLYSKNFDMAPKSVSCIDLNQRHRTLKYQQYSPLVAEGQKAILQAVYQQIMGQSDGPIYSHCWNGWHASGLAAGISLKQFCGWSNDRVKVYWERNTDGNTSGYETVKRSLKEFRPLEEFKIPAQLQKSVCPD